MYIFFDLDDTLYDFAASSLIGLGNLYENYALDAYFPSKGQWIDCYHKHNRALWELYNAAKIDQAKLRRDRFFLPLSEGLSIMCGEISESEQAEIERLTRQLDTVYLDELAATGLLLPGAKATVEALRAKGHKIGILSNGFCGVQEMKLRSSGLDALVDCVVLSDEVGINKPARGLFDYALKKSGAKIDEAVMIGDNPATDIVGAVASGWNAIYYSPSSVSDETDIEGHKIKTINQLSQLISLL